MAFLSILTLLCLSTHILARPFATSPDDYPFADAYSLQTTSTQSSDPLTVDLGYGIYTGTTDTKTNISSWKGIRFAAPPTGTNRWQLPKVPATNRSTAMPATAYGPQCPQSPNSNGNPIAKGITGNEDCLFLNVFAPAQITTALPVLVWIHGGGYGELNGHQDFTTIINANGNNFVGVSIEYRMGAFGFLSSQEVSDKGTVNAGIHDQYFALQWVQQYIKLFGGDPTKVTISGESAGGGSIMLLDMAYGGTVGTKLFQNSIAASPYLPMQYAFNSTPPTSFYNAFVQRAGCSSASDKFDCLVAASTETLQNASSYVSGSGVYGTWAFLPVTDGTLIQDLPSRQLAAGKVNGRFILTGNNAIEGASFVPHNLTTEAAVMQWLKLTFPLFSDADVQATLAQYPIENTNITGTSPRFATNGLNNPNANEVSPEATGQQQRAYNIYSETTFVCPSYWLAESYISPQRSNAGPTGYKYQYSVIPGTHGQDVGGYFNPPATPHSPDFSQAFKKIWGNFVTTNNPSISNLIANGQSTGNNTANPASAWPAFNLQTYPMMNLNESFTGTVVQGGQVYPGTGITNAISLVNAYTWEAGRGKRCDFWKSVGAKVPER